MSSYSFNNLSNPYAAYSRVGYPAGYAYNQSVYGQSVSSQPASGKSPYDTPRYSYISQSGLTPNGATTAPPAPQIGPAPPPHKTQKKSGFWQSLLSPQGLLYSTLLIAGSFAIGRVLLNKAAPVSETSLKQQVEELTKKLADEVKKVAASAKQEADPLVPMPPKETKEIAIQTETPFELTVPEKTTQLAPPKPKMSEQSVQTEPVRPKMSEQSVQTEPVRPKMSEQSVQTEPIKPQMSEHGVQTEPVRPKMSEQSVQTEPVKPEISEQSVQTEPIKPEVSEQSVQTEPIKPEVQDQATQTIAEQKPLPPDWINLYPAYSKARTNLQTQIENLCAPNSRLPAPLAEKAEALKSEMTPYSISDNAALVDEDRIRAISGMGRAGKPQHEIVNSDAAKELGKTIPELQHFIQHVRDTVKDFNAHHAQNVSTVNWFSPKRITQSFNWQDLRLLTEAANQYEQAVQKVHDVIKIPPVSDQALEKLS